MRTAQKERIPYELSAVTAGGTDAGKFPVVRAGAPSLVIGVPARCIHSHVALADLSDIENTKVDSEHGQGLDGQTQRNLFESEVFPPGFSLNRSGEMRRAERARDQRDFREIRKIIIEYVMESNTAI